MTERRRASRHQTINFRPGLRAPNSCACLKVIQIGAP